jgi:hypothetical protein
VLLRQEPLLELHGGPGTVLLDGLAYDLSR